MSKSAEPGRKAAYSSDIRWRIVWQRIGLKLTFKEIARNLNVAVSTAHSVWKRFESTGEVQASPKCKHRSRFNSREELQILTIILEEPRLSLRELCTRIENLIGVRSSPPSICRLLKRHGITRKHVQLAAKQRSADLRAQYRVRIGDFRRNQLVFLDETGCDRRDALRKMGYAVKGERATDTAIMVRGKRINVIAAISHDGVTAIECYKESIKTDNFLDFIRATLIPNMLPFDGYNNNSVLIMDNLAAHHVSEVQEYLHSVGIPDLFLPPYSPDMNPIEIAFSYVKNYLKQHEDVITSIPDPSLVIKDAFATIIPAMCNGWLTTAGY